MAIAEIKQVIYTGEPRTYSAVVHVADVVKGCLLKQHDNGQVEAATAGSGTRVIGVALHDAAVGEEVTYAMPGDGFIARLICAESQTIEAGDALVVGSTAIGGVPTLGHVAKAADQTFSSSVAKAEAEGLLADLKERVGFAVEDCTTGADTASQILVRFVGPAL